MKGRVIFVFGGTRSGKSRFAVRIAEGLGENRLYIATAEARDQEMLERIEQHQQQRGDGWRTAEEPLDVADVLEVVPDDSVILVDCITIWLSNAIERHGLFSDVFMEQQLTRLHEAANNAGFRIVLVSNEVGMGIVPDNEAARRFRDMAGEINQKAAAFADDVYFVTAGIPQKIK